MTALLVRHAEAGDRDAWTAPDEKRPLSAEGERQAEALADALRDLEIARILSSPYCRCTQTVAPLAAARGLPVEPCAEVAEGAGHAALALVRGLIDEPGVVVCTHGDVVEEVLDGLGVERPGETPKGATWIVEPGAVRYVPPPG